MLNVTFVAQVWSHSELVKGSSYRTEDFKQLLRSKPGLPGCQIRRHLRFIAYIAHFLRIFMVQNFFSSKLWGPRPLVLPWLHLCLQDIWCWEDFLF